MIKQFVLRLRKAVEDLIGKVEVFMVEVKVKERGTETLSMFFLRHCDKMQGSDCIPRFKLVNSLQ